MIKWHSEEREIRSLNPAPYNPRRLTKTQGEQLQKSLDEFGIVEPLVINLNNTMIGGHQRLKLLKKQGIKKISVSVPNRQLTEEEEKKLNLRLNKNLGEFDYDLLANGFDIDMLEDVGFDLGELGFDLDEDNEMLSSESSRGGAYNDDGIHDIHYMKLGYRLEAIYNSKNRKCIELYAGRNALTYWYKRHFKEVITNDIQRFDDANNKYNMSALDFVKNELKNHLDFDYIDFDDEGCPSQEIIAFFKCIEEIKTSSFVLCVTDGNGLNLKSHGRLNFHERYLTGSDKIIQCTNKHYKIFGEIVCDFITKIAEKTGFVANKLNFYRKENGNVVYVTYLVNKK